MARRPHRVIKKGGSSYYLGVLSYDNNGNNLCSQMYCTRYGGVLSTAPCDLTWTAGGLII